MNLEIYLKLAKREIENFNGKIGQSGVIEFHLENAIKEKEKLEKEIEQLEKFINYTKVKQENI